MHDTTTVWTLNDHKIEKNFGQKYFQRHDSSMSGHSKVVCCLLFLCLMDHGLGSRNSEFTPLASAGRVSREE